MATNASQKTDAGTSTVAFNRPFRTDSDFSLTATVNLISDSSVGEYNTDFVGMVISTVPAAELAAKQLIPWNGPGSPDHAGFGSADVKWQTAFGTQAFDSSDNEFPSLTHWATNYAHLDVVRQTIGKNQDNINSNSLFYTDKWNRSLNRQYDGKYDHSHHTVTYSVVKD